jgi:hypothetical protein
LFGSIVLEIFDVDVDPGSRIRNHFDPKSGIRDGKYSDERSGMENIRMRDPG